MSMKDKAVFLDRDGVLNVDVAYLYRIEDLQWVEGAKDALAYLSKQGYKLFVVTNQSGIARGYYTVSEMQALHEHMQQELQPLQVKIEKFFYCPHYKDGKVAEFACDCDCRKPKPGMLMQAFAEYELDKASCFMIGDKDSDLEAAAGAGIKGYKFTGGSLLDFVKNILEG